MQLFVAYGSEELHRFFVESAGYIMSLSISHVFDSGSARVLEVNEPGEIKLLLRSDNQAEFRQWFHFRLDGAKDRECRIQFMNASDAAYPEGFEGYQAVASYDRKHWFRMHTTYDGRTLAVHIHPDYDTLWVAYFAPYSYEQHQNLVAKVCQSPHTQLEVVGTTTEKRPMEVLHVGNMNTAAHHIWIIARQHPGETMAEWFAEGLLKALSDPQNSMGRKLLQSCSFHIVPNMNPDGSVHGNLRTNAAGINLNRVWNNPDPDTSPEVYGVRDKMFTYEPSLFLDIHGDEGLPYTFAAGCEGIPGYTEHRASLESSFLAHWMQSSPELQTRFGYDRDEPGQADLSIASNWVGQTFDCLSLTIEMPFKDNLACPEPTQGFSPRRASQFGQSLLPAIRAILKNL